MNFPVRLILTSACLAAVAMPAAAAEERGAEPATVVVDYRDLDLTSAAGVKAVERRLRRSVRKVCAATTPGLRDRMKARKCESMTSTQVAQKLQVAIAMAHAGRQQMASNDGAQPSISSE